MNRNLELVKESAVTTRVIVSACSASYQLVDDIDEELNANTVESNDVNDLVSENDTGYNEDEVLQ